MKTVLKRVGIAAAAMVLFIGCETTKKETPAEVTAAVRSQPIAAKPDQNTPKKGDSVPANLVCMVNNVYMGKSQLEVPFEGKMYYGCCEMCRERIPKDAVVRAAIDPLTLEKVDKANAYIVLIGDNGEVAYFKNEKNYRKFRNNK